MWFLDKGSLLRAKENSQIEGRGLGDPEIGYSPTALEIENANISVTIEEQPRQLTTEVDVFVKLKTVLVPSEGKPNIGTSVVQPGEVCAQVKAMEKTRPSANNIIAKSGLVKAVELEEID